MLLGMAAAGVARGAQAAEQLLFLLDRGPVLLYTTAQTPVHREGVAALVLLLYMTA